MLSNDNMYSVFVLVMWLGCSAAVYKATIMYNNKPVYGWRKIPFMAAGPLLVLPMTLFGNEVNKTSVSSSFALTFYLFCTDSRFPHQDDIWFIITRMIQ